tara:strand:+ start:828 stop:1013 length:186 start_codon:yes stop_codon:yes gene_type:complete
MTKKKKDWFDTHIKVMTLDDNPEQEKKIHTEIKKACVERWMRQASEVTKQENQREAEDDSN